MVTIRAAGARVFRTASKSTVGVNGLRKSTAWPPEASLRTISLAGNLLLMHLLVGLLGLPAVPANLLAVLLCSLVNFTASDRFVFRVT